MRAKVKLRLQRRPANSSARYGRAMGGIVEARLLGKISRCMFTDAGEAWPLRRGASARGSREFWLTKTAKKPAAVRSRRPPMKTILCEHSNLCARGDHRLTSVDPAKVQDPSEVARRQGGARAYAC